MARQPRDDAPGVAHHVMIRGIERRPIFVDDVDREDFLDRLTKLALELGFLIFAWALMPNHVHLVVRSAQARISRLMARLGTGYAQSFNMRHERVGHLFQNRFRSRRAVDDTDLMGLVLYATRNPLEALLVPDAAALEDYPWCGLGALVGRRRPRPFEAVAETLALFAIDPTRAVQRVREHLESAVTETRPAAREALPANLIVAPSSFDQVLMEISRRHAVRPEALSARGRTLKVSAARRELAARAAAELGLSGAEIGRRLGVSVQAVSLMLNRAAKPTS
jgi:REP element-mobilizing transposase RayT